jgi:hypothetical protein
MLLQIGWRTISESKPRKEFKSGVTNRNDEKSNIIALSLMNIGKKNTTSTIVPVIRTIKDNRNSSVILVLSNAQSIRVTNCNT